MPPIKSATEPRKTIQRRIAYAVGDAGFNVYWEFVSSFLLFFFTDIAHLSAAAAATALLAGRSIDFISGPLIGFLADHTHTRFGRFRPYLLWLSLPLASSVVLLFSMPLWNAAMTTRQASILACGTVALFSALYSAANIPYTALLTVISTSKQERMRTVSLRFAFAFLAVLFVQTTTFRLTERFGAAHAALGWQRIAALHAGVASILLLLCFAGTREVVTHQQKRQGWKQSGLRLLLLERNVLVLLLAILLSLIAFACRSAVSIYYVRYVLHRSHDVSTFLAANSVASFFACMLLPVLPSHLLNKRSLGIVCCISGVAGATCLFAVPTGWWSAILFIQALFGLCTGALLPTLFGLVADLPSQLRELQDQSVEGMLAALAILALKIGALGGSAFAGFALGHAKYQPGTAQPSLALHTITMLISALPAILLTMVGALLWLFNSDRL